MTDETKKLFDAPWRVAKDDFDYAISSASNEPIVFDSGKDGEKNSKRLARLPDLYDALVCASFEYCKGCTKSFSSPDSFLSAGCAGKDGFCPAVFWWETLRKVRDGK